MYGISFFEEFTDDTIAVKVTKQGVRVEKYNKGRPLPRGFRQCVLTQAETRTEQEQKQNENKNENENKSRNDQRLWTQGATQLTGTP